MKKGIILEQKKDYTVVLTKDGLFQKASPILHADIGAEVDYEPLPRKESFLGSQIRKKRVHMVAIACLLLVLAIPLYFMIGEDSTYAYVNVDINPSIELEVDKQLYVSSITPLNGDATLIVNDLQEGKKLEFIIEQIMKKSESDGLLNNGKHMLVGVNYVGAKETSILDRLNDHFATVGSGWEIVTIRIPTEIREKAQKTHKPMNEVMAEELGKSNSEKQSIDVKEREIIQSLYNLKQEKDESDAKQESTNNVQAQPVTITEKSSAHRNKNKKNHVKEKVPHNPSSNHKQGIKENQPNKGNNKSHIGKQKRNEKFHHHPNKWQDKKDRGPKHHNPNKKHFYKHKHGEQKKHHHNKEKGMHP